MSLRHQKTAHEIMRAYASDGYYFNTPRVLGTNERRTRSGVLSFG